MLWQAGRVALTEEPSQRIKDCLPRQRGNVRVDNLVLPNALLFVLENELQVAGRAQGVWPLAHGVSAPGRELLLCAPGPAPTRRCARLMDCADEGNEPRALARTLGCVPVVAPNARRRRPWRLNRRLYRRRNEVERLFRRLKACRRVFTRFDKRDAMCLTFVHLALIFDALR